MAPHNKLKSVIWLPRRGILSSTAAVQVVLKSAVMLQQISTVSATTCSVVLLKKADAVRVLQLCSLAVGTSGLIHCSQKSGLGNLHAELLYDEVVKGLSARHTSWCRAPS